ncbi:MAG: M48 family metallopeptidase [Lachnospiraceae bacterium]|nr:M48 family metallopeptidase [Lachnospiraceae bacterium]
MNTKSEQYREARYGDVTVPYLLIKSKRRTYAIEVSPDKGVIIRVPLRTSEKAIATILEERREWIVTHYLKMEQKREQRAKAKVGNGYTEVQRQYLEKRYREAAKEYIPKRVDYFVTLTGGSYERITIRDQKTRWGSCSGRGTLSFNWKLMLAPPAILDYVVVHELCHLTHMNHSRDFWQAVELVLPDYKERRQWLKEHGEELQL